jgi:type II secretory pathway pseudopilin PulG
MRRAVGTRVVIGLGIAVVGAAIVGGLTMIGSPGAARQRRMDERRVADLAAIGRATDLYRSRRGTLPKGLDALAAEAGAGISTLDPDTREPYEYRAIDSDSYELCARFQQPSGRPGMALDFWDHQAGRQCFVLDVQPVVR